MVRKFVNFDFPSNIDDISAHSTFNILAKFNVIPMVASGP